MAEVDKLKCHNFEYFSFKLLQEISLLKKYKFVIFPCRYVAKVAPGMNNRRKYYSASLFSIYRKQTSSRKIIVIIVIHVKVATYYIKGVVVVQMSK